MSTVVNFDNNVGHKPLKWVKQLANLHKECSCYYKKSAISFRDDLHLMLH
jgi:hypothetical protein